MTLSHRYHVLIDFLISQAGGPDKFLHTHFGLLIWVGATLVFRRRFGALAPLVVVFGIEAANEALDRVYMGRWMWSDTIGDVAATCAWPTILTLLLRQRLAVPCCMEGNPEPAVLSDASSAGQSGAQPSAPISR